MLCVCLSERESACMCVTVDLCACVFLCWHANEKETILCVPIISPHYPTLRGSLHEDSRREREDEKEKKKENIMVWMCCFYLSVDPPVCVCLCSFMCDCVCMCVYLYKSVC